MKNTLLSICFAFVYSFGFSQFTTTQNLGAPQTLVNAKGGFKADSALILPSFSDTTAANRSPFIKYYAGNTIRVGDTVYIRNTTATKWINIGSGGGGGSGYTITYQLSDSSYRLVRPDNTADTFLYTSESVFDTTSLSNRINLKLNISDTASMLNPYLRKIDTTNKWVNNITRTPGKDSIIFFIGGTRYAIKDSTGGGGGVTSVATGYGLSGGTITSTGTLIVDSATLSLKYLRLVDTSAMLSKYLRKTDTSSLSNRINLKLNISDTASMLSPYLRSIDTSGRWVNNITRTLGKDSIIFYKDGNRYAIKDSVGTNPAPVGYYGAFQDTTIQVAAAINTPYAMKLGVTDLSNAVTIVSDGSNLTRITIANTGIYNIQFSAQFDRTNSGTDVVDIWLRKNGVNVAGSGGKLVLTGGVVASAIIATWNYVLDVTAGDYYQLMWSTPDTHVRLLYETAQTSPFVHPLIPSLILTVTQQSGIMAGTGITALNGLTGAVQTFALDSTNSTFKITSSGTAHTFNIPNASASGVTRGLLSNTQYTTFNGKIGSGDTASMLTPYSRKFAAAYTMNANNTNAAASEATQTFRDSTQKAYTGTITWTGTTAPSGTTNHTYQWSQIGKLVFLRINLDYATVGAALTQLIMTLPSDCPTPLIPTNVGATHVIVYCSGALTAQKTVAAATSQSPGFSALRINAAGTGYELILTRNSQSYQYAYITLQYFAQ